MIKTTDPLTVDEARRLADDVMESTLRRAREGRLKPAEATKCAAVMQAIELYSSLRQRTELVERSNEIVRLARRLEARKFELPEEILEKARVAVRTAVAEAVTDAMKASIAKANRRRKARALK